MGQVSKTLNVYPEVVKWFLVKTILNKIIREHLQLSYTRS